MSDWNRTVASNEVFKAIDNGDYDSILDQITELVRARKKVLANRNLRSVEVDVDPRYGRFSGSRNVRVPSTLVEVQ